MRAAVKCRDCEAIRSRKWGAGWSIVETERGLLSVPASDGGMRMLSGLVHAYGDC